ncbi:MAG: pyrroloquinoline quinone-dependent dehydrogenase [Acetobacteraceae bacterium]
MLALCAAAGLGLRTAPAMAQQQSTAGGAPAATEAPAGGADTVPIVKGDTRPVGVNVDVSDNDRLGAAQNTSDWLLYGRTYDNQRFSPLTEIKAANVKELRPVAIIQTGVANSFEVSPIEVNGILYISTADNHVQAYDATTGKELWAYTPELNFSSLCCGHESRGVAVAYGKVFMATLDARVMALDASTGKVLWTAHPVADRTNATQYSFTMAPQIYDGVVIVGSSGAEYPTRGFVAGLDANTGKQLWMFHTTAAPGEPGGDTWSADSWKVGGGSVWNTPAIDPANGLLIFAEGNPNPDNWGDSRKGANAYTDSIVALHVKDGTLAWWYQEVPHDMWDYDATGPVVLLNAKDGSGKMVQAAAEAGKEGQVFIVNRRNGQLIRKSAPFVMQSSTMWTVPGEKPVLIYPGAQGGNEWSPEAFSAQTRYFYVMGTNQAWKYEAHPPGVKTADNSKLLGLGLTLGSVLQPITEPHPSGTIPPTGTLSAVDVDTGQIAWQYKSDLPMVGGVTTTAGNLVFGGEMNGDFDAFDAKSGRKLWSFNLGAGVQAPPVTYSVDGVQYVAVAAGGNAANGNPEIMERLGKQYGDAIAIFALPRR